MLKSTHVLTTAFLLMGFSACELGEGTFEDDVPDGEYEDDDDEFKPDGISAAGVDFDAVLRVKTDRRSRTISAALRDTTAWDDHCPDPSIYGRLTVTYRASSSYIHVDKIKLTNYNPQSIVATYATFDLVDHGYLSQVNVKKNRRRTLLNGARRAAHFSTEFGSDGSITIRVDISQVGEPWFCGGTFVLVLKK